MTARHLSGLTALVVALFSTPAAAYVRTINSKGVPVRWANTCISLVAHTENVPKPLDGKAMFRAVEAAGSIWGRPSYSCTPLTLTTTEEEKAPGVVARDGVNRVMFVTDKWCRQTGTSERVCYAKQTLAITTVVADSNGKIIEADIEINGINFDWADRVLHPNAVGQDLQTVVVHELGHLVGLDHNCAYPGTTYDRKNDLGEVVPYCNVASSAERNTVMYPSASDSGQVKRRLSADETKFVCGVYPAAEGDFRPVCGPILQNQAQGEEIVADDGGGGCSVSGRAAPAGAFSLAPLALALLWLRRRSAR